MKLLHCLQVRRHRPPGQILRYLPMPLTSSQVSSHNDGAGSVVGGGGGAVGRLLAVVAEGRAVDAAATAPALSHGFGGDTIAGAGSKVYVT